MLPVAGDVRLGFLRAASLLCCCSAAALDLVVLLCLGSEALLTAALVLTHSVAFSLSAMLKLTSLLRLALAGVLPSRQNPDHRGGGTSSGRLSSDRSHSPLSACVAALVRPARSAVSPLLSHVRPAVASVVILSGCIRPLLSTLKTVLVSSVHVLSIVWDLS